MKSRARARLKVELQSRPRPARFHQLPRPRQRDVRITHVRSTEADIRRQRIREADVLERAVRLEDRDAAVEQCRRAHVAARFHRETVEQLMSWQRANDPTALPESKRSQLAGLDLSLIHISE